MSTRLRINSANDFEKKIYKLCINSVCGKTMQNVRNHRDIKIEVIEKEVYMHLNQIIIVLNTFQMIY